MNGQLKDDNKNLCFQMEDIGIKNKNGEYLNDESLVDYLKKEREKLIIIKEKLQIGDIIKLRNTGEIVTIQVNDGYPFLYKGKSSFKNNLICFNQENIEEVISSNLRK